MTERLPFDPDRVAGPPAEPGQARRERARFKSVPDARPLSVTELSDLIRTTLEQRIESPIRVVGEVSNLTTRGHWYFSLKDDRSVLGCVVWASNVRRVGFEPRDGHQVVATGSVSHYGPQGRTQLYVTRLEQVGAGALEQKFRALCDELRRAGYFDDGRKRALPPYPRCIAVVTSKNGAALGDVIQTASQRWPAVRLLIFDVRVQGDGAAVSVTSAIRRINRSRQRLGVDAILITRGGGSIEDLWTFNEQIVAEAIYRSELPIVAAIGHESDTTIAELVADVRASTPTQAVMRLIPDRAALARQIEHIQHRAQSLATRLIEREHQRLAALARAELLRRPRSLLERSRRETDQRRTALRQNIRARLGAERTRLEHLAARLSRAPAERIRGDRLRRADILSERLRQAMWNRMAGADRTKSWRRDLRTTMKRHLRLHRQRLRWQEDMLDAVEVRRVLARGFTFTTRDEDGQLIRSVKDASPGAHLTTHVADGTIRSTVDGKASPNPKRRQRPPRQMDLFAGSD